MFNFPNHSVHKLVLTCWHFLNQLPKHSNKFTTLHPRLYLHAMRRTGSEAAKPILTWGELHYRQCSSEEIGHSYRGGLSNLTL
jgi:hypothetical protein